MYTYAEKIAKRNLKRRKNPDINITANGMKELRRKLAKELEENERAQQDSERVAAGPFGS